MKGSTRYNDKTLLEAPDHRHQRIGTAGDSSSSHQRRGERDSRALTVLHGQRLLEMAVSGRFRRSLTAISGDQLLVLSVPSTLLAGGAIGATVRSCGERC